MALYKKELAILYVDDEEKSLEYFTKSFQDEFKIYTADNVSSALDVLKENFKDICVIITDQRMPKQTGVDLLKEVRLINPNIVRILTTGYTDLNDAISAVNRGEIFRYITKPWDLNALHAELISALSFYIVQQERNLLLNEKSNITYQILKVDRIRDLVMITANQILTDNKFQAINAFITQITSLEPRIQYPRVKELETIDQNTILTHEHDRLSAIAYKISNATSNLNQFDIDSSHAIDFNTICQKAIDEKQSDIFTFNVNITSNNFTSCYANPELLVQLINDSLSFMIEISEKNSAITFNLDNVKKIWSNSGIKLTITSNQTRFFDLDSESILNAMPNKDTSTLDMQLDLLTCFFTCFHFGGNLTIKRRNSEATIGLFIPNKPSDSMLPTLERSWLPTILQLDSTGFANEKDMYSTKISLPTVANVKQDKNNEYYIKWMLPNGEHITVKGKQKEQVIQLVHEAIKENLRTKQLYKSLDDLQIGMLINRIIISAGLLFIFAMMIILN